MRTFFSHEIAQGWNVLMLIAQDGSFKDFQLMVSKVFQLEHYSKEELLNIFAFASIHFDGKNVFMLAAERPEDGYECLQILKSHPIAKEVYQELLDTPDKTGKTLRAYEEECEERYRQRIQRLENKRKAMDDINNPSKKISTGN